MLQKRLIPPYCIDSSSLIDLDRWYPKNKVIFLPIWKQIEKFVASDKIIAPIEVQREIQNGNNKLIVWCQQNRKIFINVDNAQVSNLQKVKTKYNLDYWNTQTNGLTAWADPWIISLSICMNAIIVTNESKTKANRIPVIAQNFGIRCLNLLEFFGDIGIK
ncbi:MAG: DUF4411 family protein [Candidatus Aenigmarchaeota archaeon]|nr:DUF4411 family protein [Candidatus Aenigmarchaeota archaeon]